MSVFLYFISYKERDEAFPGGLRLRIQGCYCVAQVPSLALERPHSVDMDPPPKKKKKKKKKEKEREKGKKKKKKGEK